MLSVKKVGKLFCKGHFLQQKKIKQQFSQSDTDGLTKKRTDKVNYIATPQQNSTTKHVIRWISIVFLCVTLIKCKKKFDFDYIRIKI